ncbi:MAG TPA: T9SS type A sorting domain-containing protein [Bacteroidia bacterium]|nr:T9SS type A sorting domain-containing protein [Bacteroidia bacterium]
MKIFSNLKVAFGLKTQPLKLIKSFILLNTILILSVLSNSYAQTDYQPFFKDSLVLYKGVVNDLNGFYIQYQKSSYKAAAFDSVVNNSSNTYYYPFKTANDTSVSAQGGDCIDLNGNSWMGKYFHHNAQQHYFFYNKIGDSIMLHTQEHIGHNWVFYTYPNNSYLRASIINILYNNMAGIVDSIKVISLQYFDSLGNVLINDWTQKEILLSQNYGIIKMPCFNNFPQDTSMWTRQNNLGIASSSDIYNFHIGDQFYYQQGYSNDEQGYFHAIDYTLLEVLNKNIDAANSLINYTFKRVYYNYHVVFPSPAYLDTIVESTFDVSFPLNESMGIPEKTSFDSLFNLHFNLMENYSQEFNFNIEIPVHVRNTRIYIFGNNCYSTAITTLPIKSIYARWLGEIYKEEYWEGFNGSAPFSTYFKLIGFQKNGINYGNFLELSELKNQQNKLFSINGNIGENIHLEWFMDEAGTIDIYSSSGKLLIKEYINKGKHQLSISDMAQGIYLVRGYTNKNSFVQKIIKQ